VLFALVAAIVVACSVNALEPIEGMRTCVYDASAAGDATPVTLELGRVVDGAFVAFAGGENVELAPWPFDELPGKWSALLAVRLSNVPEGADSGCFHLTGGFGEGFEYDALGYLVERLANGDLVARVVPYGVAMPPDFTFDEWLGTETPFIVGGRVTTPAGLLEAPDVRMFLKVVNEDGVLSERRVDAGPVETTDAGIVEIQPDFSAFLLIRQPRLRPGETSAVELTVNGSRAGKAIEFVKHQVTGAMVVLERNDIAAEVPDAEARTTTGTLGIDLDAAPGDYTLQVTVRTTDLAYEQVATYDFTILVP